MKRTFVLFNALVGLVVLSALGCSGEEVPSSSTSGAGGAPPSPPEAVACDAHAVSGPASFTEKTVAWGLAGVTGILLSAGDMNGDGYPDLIAHSFANNQREIAGETPHYYHVLWNEPAPGGGRTFVDRTAESGYGATTDKAPGEYRAAQMAIFGDVDNDGDLDVFSGTYTDANAVKDPPTPGDLDRSTLLLNEDGKGHLVPAPPSAIADDKPAPIAGASFVDANLDGSLDLFIGHWYTAAFGYSYQRLLFGDKSSPGVFSDVSVDAGIRVTGNRRPAFGVTACDLNDDGSPELLVSSYGRAPNMLFQSDAPSHFAEIGVPSGFAYDDNLTFKDNQFFLCYCQLSPADPECAGVPAPMVVCPSAAELPSYWNNATAKEPEHLGGNTFTTVCSDITGDGAMDLYNAEIVHWWTGKGSDPSELLVNASDASGIHFERPGREATGMTWPHPTIDWNEGGLYAAAGDMDNDAREDVIVGASDYDDQYGLYFHQKPGGVFEEIAEASGFRHPCASAPIIADFDRDGDLDIVVGSSRMREWCTDKWPTSEVLFYESDAGERGHHLAIRLRGDGATTNAAGIGARVIVETEAADGSIVKQTKELGGGYGHYGMQNDTALFFGLGGCGMVHSVEVVWPNAARTKDRFEDVAADRLIELRQGDPVVYEIIAAGKLRVSAFAAPPAQR